MRTAKVAALKKLLVEVQPTTLRRIGWWKTNASPSLISSRSRTSGCRGVGRGLVLADPDRGHRRDEEAQRVDHDRVPGAERADEHASEARAGHLPERLARAELAVGVHEVLGLDEHRQVALVRDVEEHGEHAGDDRDDEELRQVEHAERVGDRDRADDGHAPDVGPDEHRPAAPPVDPRAGGQRDRGGRRAACTRRARRPRTSSRRA